MKRLFLAAVLASGFTGLTYAAGEAVASTETATEGDGSPDGKGGKGSKGRKGKGGMKGGKGGKKGGPGGKGGKKGGPKGAAEDGEE